MKKQKSKKKKKKVISSPKIAPTNNWKTVKDGWQVFDEFVESEIEDLRLQHQNIGLI